MRLETGRLLLRPLSLEDLDEFVELHADPEVTRYVSSFDRAAAEERLRANDREWEQRGHGMFAVLEREREEFIGRTAIKHWPQFDETEAGWTLRRAAWGRGFATEAARACVEWAFAEFEMPYLTAMIVPGNERSVGVAEHLGMTVLREDELLGEAVIVHALRRPE